MLEQQLIITGKMQDALPVMTNISGIWL